MMKRIYCIGLFQMIICALVSAQTPIPASVDRQFKRDAARMALRLDAEREDTRYLAVTINRENTAMLYRALTTIYRTDETAKSIARCNVHTFPNPSIDHLIVIYKRNTEWAAPLRQGITETSSKELNKLLDQYDLVIEKHVQWNDTQDALTIRSKEPLNMAALASKFDDIKDVVQIDLGVPKLQGNDIKARRVGGAWEIDFVLQFGSSGAGGAKQHTWKYQVLDNGTAKLLKESGEPIPAYMKCSNGEEPKNFVSKG
jgi:hypothetical protein